MVRQIFHMRISPVVIGFPVESCLCNRRRTPCRKRKTITGDALFFIVGEKIVVEKDTDVWLCNRFPVRPIYIGSVKGCLVSRFECI